MGSALFRVDSSLFEEGWESLKKRQNVACEQAHLCKFGENYFGGGADIQRGKVSLHAGYWFLNYAPFKVSRYYPIGAKQKKLHVQMSCYAASETNTKEVNFREADHFHFDKRQK